MTEETDGVREAFDDALRIALTVATQLGEKVARLREEFARQREAGALQTNRELEARFEAERAAMRASLLPLKQHGWWEHASVTDIANARETAVAWRDYDDVARETNDVIEREVGERYGVDAGHPGADPAKVVEALDTAASERAEALATRSREGKELTAAEMVLLAADRHDRASMEPKSDQLASRLDYDSAARRDEFAASLSGVADPATIAARVLADGENARHPRDSVLPQERLSQRASRNGNLDSKQRIRDGIGGR